MKIALIGYGKMGRLIEEQANKRGHEVLAKFSSSNKLHGKDGRTFLRNADVCIDFSITEAVRDNVLAAVESNVPIVIGTTGWNGYLDEIKDYVVEHEGALVYGSNFSFGMNAFFRIVKAAAQLLANSDQYDLFMIEQHHKWKKDAPSGTALTLQQILTEQLPEKSCEIACIRSGYAAGTHEIRFDSDADIITLSHVARNRNGFAAGAILAAEWINGKKGFYQFQDIIFE